MRPPEAKSKIPSPRTSCKSRGAGNGACPPPDSRAQGPERDRKSGSGALPRIASSTSRNRPRGELVQIVKACYVSEAGTRLKPVVFPETKQRKIRCQGSAVSSILSLVVAESSHQRPVELLRDEHADLGPAADLCVFLVGLGRVGESQSREPSDGVHLLPAAVAEEARVCGRTPCRKSKRGAHLTPVALQQDDRALDCRASPLVARAESKTGS